MAWDLAECQSVGFLVESRLQTHRRKMKADSLAIEELAAATISGVEAILVGRKDYSLPGQRAYAFALHGGQKLAVTGSEDRVNQACSPELNHDANRLRQHTTGCESLCV